VKITHVFFDIGGVLGSNGWDHEQRERAASHFGLDLADLTERHQETVGTLEAGRMSLDEYLDCVVFHAPRAFTRDDFRRFMFEQSTPHPDTIALARGLAATGRYRLMTLNNESAELNAYRVRHFGLREIFSAFFSSCWLGITKPARRIYEIALAVSQAEPAGAVFIDDRRKNLDPARALGMRVVHYSGAPRLAEDLAALDVTT